MFANGIIRLIIPITITRTVGLWFRGKNLGMAMGISAMGMGLGLSLGPLLSATYVSPLLNGWRNVMFLYGGISAFVGVVWLVLGKEPPADPDEENAGKVPFRHTIGRLVRMKALWFIGLTFMTRMGSMMGLTGYLPLFLLNQGWEGALADSTLAAFYAISTLCVVLLLMSGIFMDGFMAINTTILLETEGIGSRYSGTALGLIFTIGHIGSVASPPIGNSFASINPGLPFTFWAVLSVIGLISLSFVKETGWRKKMFGKPAHPELG
jgi:MFS family permease